MISVIVPVYNVQMYLDECINSIMRQTYKDLEIILVDDGSTDMSGNICDNYARLDSRISVYHKLNGGLSDARNFGITRASGDEITFVDSDDVISDNMIETLFLIKEKYNAQISVCFREQIDENGNIISSKLPYVEREYFSENTEESFKIYFESEGAGVVAWGKLYDADLFNDVLYPVGRYNEDAFTTYKLIAKCRRLAITSKRLYLYRIRNGSIMNRTFEKRHLDVIYGMNEMTSYLECNYNSIAIYAQRLLIYSTLQVALRILYSGQIDLDGINLIRNTLSKYKRVIYSSAISYKAKILAIFLMNSPCGVLSCCSSMFQLKKSKNK